MWMTRVCGTRVVMSSYTHGIDSVATNSSVFSWTLDLSGEDWVQRLCVSKRKLEIFKKVLLLCKVAVSYPDYVALCQWVEQHSPQNGKPIPFQIDRRIVVDLHDGLLWACFPRSCPCAFGPTQAFYHMHKQQAWDADESEPERYI